MTSYRLDIMFKSQRVCFVGIRCALEFFQRLAEKKTLDPVGQRRAIKADILNFLTWERKKCNTIKRENTIRKKLRVQLREQGVKRETRELAISYAFFMLRYHKIDLEDSTRFIAKTMKFISEYIERHPSRVFFIDNCSGIL